MKYLVQNNNNKIDYSIAILPKLHCNICNTSIEVYRRSGRPENALDFSLRVMYISSHLLSSPYFSSSLLLVTQTRGHIYSGRSSPLPTAVLAFKFLSRQVLSLVDSRRIVRTRAIYFALSVQRKEGF